MADSHPRNPRHRRRNGKGDLHEVALLGRTLGDLAICVVKFEIRLSYGEIASYDGIGNVRHGGFFSPLIHIEKFGGRRRKSRRVIEFLQPLRKFRGRGEDLFFCFCQGTLETRVGFHGRDVVLDVLAVQIKGFALHGRRRLGESVANHIPDLPNLVCESLVKVLPRTPDGARARLDRHHERQNQNTGRQ